MNVSSVCCIDVRVSLLGIERLLSVISMLIEISLHQI